MFSSLKQKMSEKWKIVKKAAFLALVGYIYDKVANRKKNKKEYVDNVDYEVKNNKD